MARCALLRNAMKAAESVNLTWTEYCQTLTLISNFVAKCGR